jgi:hypothetical protein
MFMMRHVKGIKQKLINDGHVLWLLTESRTLHFNVSLGVIKVAYRITDMLQLAVEIGLTVMCSALNTLNLITQSQQVLHKRRIR